MRELTRSNDPVFLSYLRAELGAEGIEALVLDAFASSVLEPMNMTALQRVMVTDDDYWRAWTVVEEAEGRISEDTVLGGRVHLLQPKVGFRAAIDPILLAAVAWARREGAFRWAWDSSSCVPPPAARGCPWSGCRAARGSRPANPAQVRCLRMDRA